VKKRCFILVLLFQSIRIFSENPYYSYTINAIPYNDFSFSFERNSEKTETIITILGWSRDGKILYEERYSSYYLKYYIRDMVEDITIWSASEELISKGIRLDDYISNPSFLKSFITEKAIQYDILPIVDAIGRFPYNNEIGKFSVLATNITSPSPSSGYDVDIFITQNFYPYKWKKINILKIGWHTYFDPLEYYYAKSPFENRLAVIVILPRIGEIGDIDYEFTMFGCNLNVGFTLER
jgi:hypothetical protein